jgi:acyl-CoA synthetase (AMP-forming)/AMP-acid ligase II
MRRFDTMRVSTLVELLGERARRSPERLTYVFLRDGETEASRLSLGELDRRAKTIASALQRLNARGERALLFYPAGEDFVSAFFGCMYAAVIAVPVPPPTPGRMGRALPHMQAIVHDAQARLVLTTSRVCAQLPKFLSTASELEGVQWLATDALPADDQEWMDPAVDSTTTAFLQYTSGSTANPKGVAVTHANILHNQAAIQQRFEASEETVCVTWLPLHHDMGLIGTLLGSMYCRGRTILMSPEAFLQQPIRWLQAISRYRADASGGPNFAFDHCVARISTEQRATLDLSSWTLAFTGAEPVRAETLQRFTRTFEPCGFRAKAFFPCYGLAESTLFVCGGTRDTQPVVKTLRSDALERGTAIEAGDSDAAAALRRVVSCGPAAPDHDVAIVDPESRRERQPGEVGEIWVSGPSVAGGYWNQAEETERVFHARLFDVDDRVFLRTGDLGFMSDGELFVTGRLKELIIIDGRNHYPHDIERTAEAADPVLRPGACAAFSVDAEGVERLVIAAEVQRRELKRHSETADDTARAIRRAVAETHGVDVHAVRLLSPGSIPKTSSGKLRRLACRDAFLAGTFDVVEGEANVDPV